MRYGPCWLSHNPDGGQPLAVAVIASMYYNVGAIQMLRVACHDRPSTRRASARSSTPKVPRAHSATT